MDNFFNPCIIDFVQWISTLLLIHFVITIREKLENNLKESVSIPNVHVPNSQKEKNAIDIAFTLDSAKTWELSAVSQFLYEAKLSE